ncbi:hypothetical protein Y032_0014g2380 [Ancylostoma ceylanicum]|uniref:Uncharacterized protein n=1 Tax=Ancylostoma ceylanicum TaxID=53326 RepID=A0A016VAA7_9BILA|nr:hypothetical protein Y032_0014g2380 [Ancylostoma ceylanicum]
MRLALPFITQKHARQTHAISISCPCCLKVLFVEFFPGLAREGEKRRCPMEKRGGAHQIVDTGINPVEMRDVFNVVCNRYVRLTHVRLYDEGWGQSHH